MLDAQLLSAAIKCRSAWERVQKYVRPDEMIVDVAFWWRIVSEFYRTDKQLQSIDMGNLAAVAAVRVTNPKHEDRLRSVLADLPDASPDNVSQIALELRRHVVGLELAAAITGLDKRRVPELLELYSELLKAEKLGDDLPYSDAPAWGDLDKVVGRAARIPLAPRKINERTGGGAVPGDSILLVGRPEMGKSSAAINMGYGFLWSGQRVAHFVNEEPETKTKARYRNRLSEMSPEEVEREPEKANKIAAEREGGRLLVRHIRGGGVDEVERGIVEFEPTCIIVDQIRGLGGGSDGLTAQLEESGKQFRRLLSTYGLVGVAVTQAWGGAEGKVWLTMEDIDSSKTGLPGAFDLIIGIGANDEMKRRNQRALSLPKNKLSSQDDAHEGVIVEVDLKRSKFK